MPAKVSVPDSLSSLLHHFRSCFTAPGYEVFTAMFTGFILRPVERTVCGMLTGAGLAGVWHHSRAHRFFANTRWDVRQVGMILAALVVEVLLSPEAPILLAIDETLTRRRGPKVFAASWWHDGSAAGAAKIGYGNSWVVLAIVVTLPFRRRPIARTSTSPGCTPARPNCRSSPPMTVPACSPLVRGFSFISQTPNI